MELNEKLPANEKYLDELLQASEAAPLLELKGLGPVTAATCLSAWSHDGRLSSEAGSASLAGVNPIPASSGNTILHRLNRGGDRSLNSALHTVARCRITHDPETRAYVEKRRGEGKSDRETRRCIKQLFGAARLPGAQCRRSSSGEPGLTDIEEWIPVEPSAPR